MARPTFLPLLRISVIVDFLLVFCAVWILNLTAAKSPSNWIDDGGLTVPMSLPLNSRQVLAIKTRPMTLHCPILIESDSNVLDLWWLKDGSKLDLNPQHNPTSSTDSQPVPRIWITNDGDLHFEKIIHKVGFSRSNFDTRHKNYTDEGDYRCVVKSAIGVVFSPVITVSVAVFEVKEEQTEVKVKTGQSALLQCQIASTPPLTSTHVTWQRGSTNISSRLAQNSTNRFSILVSGILVISAVQPSDSGTYSCLARHNLLDTNRTVHVKLVVEPMSEVISSEPPKFLPGNDEENITIILDEDEEQSLDCLASGIPPPTIAWALTYEIVNETTATRTPFSTILSEGNHFHDSIVLSTVENSAAHTYSYTCIVQNGIGGPISKTFQVARLPALLKAPNSYKYPPAKTVRFECNVETSTYSIIWYKDGQRLEVGKGRVKGRGNELVISNTIRNDSGFYQCEVIADDRIYAVGTARLFVENNRPAPDPPLALQCIQSLSRSLVISWKMAPRENNNTIHAFSIHYMPIGGEERQKVTPSKVNEYTIENLKPYTNYSIYVRSYSAKAASGQSSIVICGTMEDVPIKAPKSFTIEKYGPPSQLRIRWRQLTDSEARGKVILYKLQWKLIDGEFTNVRYIDGDSQEFLITDLSRNEPIDLRLLPSTSVGWPSDKDNFPWSRINSTNFDTNATVPDDYYVAPVMYLTVLNSTSIFVNWSEPPRPKDVSLKGFRLTYSTELATVEDFVFFGPFHVYNYSQRTYVFTDFAPSTSYEVQLQTFGDSWESEVASKFIRTFSASNDDNSSPSTILPVISGLQVYPISPSEVRLSWDVPRPLNSHINFFYTIKYNEADRNKFDCISSTSEFIEIKGLRPYTSYEFAVQLTSDGGENGPFSQKIESRTLPGLPGPPIQLHWRVLNQTLVEVEWQPPSSTNGVIQKYWVQYKHKNESVQSSDRHHPVNNDTTWRSKATQTTSLFLENLLQNEDYMVRVVAETKAGVGNPSDIISIRIFIRKPEPEPPKDDPNELVPSVPGSNGQKLGIESNFGIFIGVGLSLLFITVCAVILLNRHRLFPILARQPVALHVNGNGLPPRAKRSVDSFTGVEMKVFETLTANDQHLDTKGGHHHSNGIIPGPTDPLLMRIVRNPIDDSQGQDEESVPNCIH